MTQMSEKGVLPSYWCWGIWRRSCKLLWTDFLVDSGTSQVWRSLIGAVGTPEVTRWSCFRECGERKRRKQNKFPSPECNCVAEWLIGTGNKARGTSSFSLLKVFICTLSPLSAEPHRRQQTKTCGRYRVLALLR